MKLEPGVLTGKALQELFAYMKSAQCALPSVNVINTHGINAALHAARRAKAPIMIQFSHSGAQFYAGKFLDNADHSASIVGALAGAQHVRAMALAYGVPVVLHTDHAAKKLLPWVEGLLEHGERYHAAHGQPLFSSHMLDLSLQASQREVQQRRGTAEKPISFVFHGGSGSSRAEIHEAVSYGVVKMNVDTDTQWAFCQPIKAYMDEHDAYLHGQLGNPSGPDQPNKKYIDPRAWLHEGERGMADRLLLAFEDLDALGKFQF